MSEAFFLAEPTTVYTGEHISVVQVEDPGTPERYEVLMDQNRGVSVQNLVSALLALPQNALLTGAFCDEANLWLFANPQHGG